MILINGVITEQWKRLHHLLKYYCETICCLYSCNQQKFVQRDKEHLRVKALLWLHVVFMFNYRPDTTVSIQTKRPLLWADKTQSLSLMLTHTGHFIQMQTEWRRENHADQLRMVGGINRAYGQQPFESTSSFSGTRTQAKISHVTAPCQHSVFSDIWLCWS